MTHISNREREEIRWANYRKGILEHEKVRKNELEHMLYLIDPQENETIFEIGTGSGYLTLPIARKLKKGRIITADINVNGLRDLETENLPIEKLIYENAYGKTYRNFPLDFDENIDKISSLATFHHFDIKEKKELGKNTKDIGRRNLLEECFKMLKPGGSLIIGDVIKNTQTQQYFDKIDNPIHFAPLGHPHDFYSIEEFNETLSQIGYTKIRTEIKEVPWIFESVNQTANFLKKIHNAQCLPKESLDIAREVLGMKKTKKGYELNWQLGFIKAYK